MGAKTISVGPMYRSVSFDDAAIDADKRTVTLSFASEAQILTRDKKTGQPFYEVLNHSPECVSMDRLRSGGPLLMDHDPKDQVGVVDSADVGADKKCRAVVRFSKSQRGNEIFQDVLDGIRRTVSVGYRWLSSPEYIGTRDGLDVLSVNRWEPFEVTLTSVPADPSVGVGRSKTEDSADFTIHTQEDMKRTTLLDADPAISPPSGAAPAAPSPEIVIKRERERTLEIRKIAASKRTQISDVHDLADAAIESGVSPDAFGRSLLEKMGSKPIENADAAPRKTETAIRSLGELLTDSQEYRALVKGGKLGGSRFERAIEIPEANVRATLTTTVAGLTKYERPSGIVLVEQQPLTVAQLLAPGQTENTTIRYMQEDTFTNAAAALAEEGQYAEASWDLSEQDASVVKIGVIGRVTDEIFADSAAVQSYVNARLPFMVQAKEDYYLLNGTGLNNQVKGLLNVTGIQTEALANSPDAITAIHKGITKVRSTGFYEPDHILLNPTDWQNVKLTKDGNGQFLAGGPFQGQYGVGGYSNVMMLWGLPCVSTTAIAQGTALVGAFRLGAQLFRRQGLSIETTNSDASDFAYGRIAIRVTERLALATYRPTAFCSVTGLVA
jgi:HK97 family phage major capsid protein